MTECIQCEHCGAYTPSEEWGDASDMDVERYYEENGSDIQQFFDVAPHIVACPLCGGVTAVEA